MSATEAETKGTLATSVYDQLRTDLLSGLIEPNSKVRVEWVVSQYRAGASPVREALNRLASEGLLDRQEQRGFSVVPVSEEELRELTRTRCLVEETALRESVKYRDAAWEEQIVLALHRLSRVPRRQTGEEQRPNPEWELLHRKFHRALISSCRSRWLINFCEHLADHAYRYRQIAISNAAVSRDQMAEHRAIAEYAIAGDVDAAVAALKSHFQRTSDLCLEWLRAQEAASGRRFQPARGKSQRTNDAP
ncbi:MAG: GntR family transcriptional regulator [Bryobacteraceae bacterium]